MPRALITDYGGVLTDLGEQVDGSASTGPPLVAYLRTLRRRGVRTALLSNANTGGAGPPGLHELFDVVVLSGEVGIAKPAPAIYRLTAQRLGLACEDCVFVDDLPRNVLGAMVTGMVGVHHRDPPTTITELDALFPPS